jgi:hypothetical protein
VGGEIEYLGRLDHQVKIRGFRIELGEVESVLQAHPGVREAVVLAREDVPGQQRLVGYVVGEEADAPGADELRAFLAATLPEYMVPASFVALPALPLSPNGKVDRGALPPAEAGGTAGEDSALRTPTEEMLAGIWAEVLRVRHVGVHDNFFILGGHSLLVLRAAARVRQACGVDLPLRMFFEHPTLRPLARAIEGARGVGAATPIVPVPRDGGVELPLSAAQQWFWLKDQVDRIAGAGIIVSARRVEGPLRPRALARALASVVRRHEALRTVFPAVDGRPRQRILAAAAARPLHAVDLAGLEAEAREQALRTWATRLGEHPFRLAEAPPFRAVLLRLAPGDHVLLLAVHHIVCDGWAMGVVHRDLGAFYRAEVEGVPAALPELPVQYADYAAWEGGQAAGEPGARQAAHWRARLEGTRPVLARLADDPERLGSAGDRGTEPLRLGEEEAASLRRLLHDEGATGFMGLLAVLGALLHAGTGEADVVVAADAAGRERAEMQGVVGTLASMWPQRIDMAGDPTFRELLRRTRKRILEDSAHQALPSDTLRGALVGDGDGGPGHLGEIDFSYTAGAGAAPRLAGVESRAYPVARTLRQGGLGVSLADEGEAIRGLLTFNADAFRPETARRLARGFEWLAAAAAADPDLPLSALSARLAAEEQRRRALQAGELALAASTRLRDSIGRRGRR